MADTAQNATVYQDNYWVFRFTVTDEDQSGSPPRDITTDRIFWALARLTAGGDPLVDNPLMDFDSTDDPTVVVKTSPAVGQVEVRLLAPLNADLRPGDYWHELEVEDAAGNPVVSATGTVTVRHNVRNA